MLGPVHYVRLGVPDNILDSNSSTDCGAGNMRPAHKDLPHVLDMSRCIGKFPQLRQQDRS